MQREAPYLYLPAFPFPLLLPIRRLDAPTGSDCREGAGALPTRLRLDENAVVGAIDDRRIGTDAPATSPLPLPLLLLLLLSAPPDRPLP